MEETANRSLGHVPAPRRRSGRVMSFVATLRKWHQRSRSRSELAEMDEQSLIDLGMSIG